jgi:hypothetical protein
MSYQSTEIKYIEPHAKRIYNDCLFQQKGIISDYYQFEKLKYLEFVDVQYLYLNHFIYNAYEYTKSSFITNRVKFYINCNKPIKPIGKISIEKGLELF